MSVEWGAPFTVFRTGFRQLPDFALPLSISPHAHGLLLTTPSPSARSRCRPHRWTPASLNRSRNSSNRHSGTCLPGSPRPTMRTAGSYPLSTPTRSISNRSPNSPPSRSPRRPTASSSPPNSTSPTTPPARSPSSLTTWPTPSTTSRARHRPLAHLPQRAGWRLRPAGRRRHRDAGRLL